MENMDNSNLKFDTALLPEMLDASHDMFFIINLENKKIVYVNEMVYKKFGYTLDEMNTLGIEGFRRSMEDHEQSFATHIEELQNEGRAIDFAYIITKDGSEFPVEVNARLVEKDDVLYNIASVRDISNRVKAEKKLFLLNKNLENLVVLRTEALQKNIAFLSSYKNVMDESNIISKSDIRGNITYVNDRFCEVCGYTRDELLGQPHSIIRHLDTKKEIFKDLWKSIKAKQSWKAILKNRKKDGSYYWVDIVIMPILDFRDEIYEYIAVRHDITELIDQREKLQKIVTTDSLTSLYNRYKLLEDIESLENPSIALLDISRFSYINDIYGHHFGDKLLTQIGQKIQDLIADHDTKALYRVHSDIFAILNISLVKNAFIQKIENIVKVLDECTFIVEDQEIIIDVKASISFEKEDLYITADMAMKHLKQSGLSVLVYHHQLNLNDQYQNNIIWTNNIRNAIARDTFVPFFQPIVNNQTGKWEKYECLVRLIDESGKVISPFFFLEIAKHTKYYEIITKRMIQKSFDTFAKSSAKFSINLTIKDILSKDIQKYIEEMLSKYKIGDRVVFEIVESEGIEDYEEVLKFILKVKGHGCKIAIDDFGTGYSNFNYLLKLQTDYIKIDGSLIQNIDTNVGSRVLVKTIVSFARELGIKTIAEFVENEKIFMIVKELGVDYTQGYFFSQPLSAPDFSK